MTGSLGALAALTVFFVLWALPFVALWWVAAARGQSGWWGLIGLLGLPGAALGIGFILFSLPAKEPRPWRQSNLDPRFNFVSREEVTVRRKGRGGD